jgi:sorting and assembly machinery component 37
LEAVQLWNLPGIEQEEKPHFWEREKLKEPTEGDRKEKFKRVFEREKVLEKARSSLDIYARLLGRKRYFFSDRPTTLDVYLASHILLLLDAPFPDPLLQSLLTESYPTLTAHARQIHLQAFPTTGSNIPLLAPQNYTLRSLVPWQPAKIRKSIPKPKSEEDIWFDRMRWGWIALVVISAVVYVAQSGIVMELRDLDISDEGDEEYESRIVEDEE